MTLEEAKKQIRPVDQEAVCAAQKRWDSIAKPLHSLGKMEKIVMQIAGITGSADVRLDKRALVAMCADNGVVEEGVTQTGQEVTAIVAENFLKGDTSACVMCRQCGTDVFPVDVGMASDTKVPSDLKVMMGTRNMTKEPAMTYEEAVQGIEAGIEMVRRLKEQGYRQRISPLTKDYMIASHVSREPAAAMILEALEKEAVLHGEMCLGEGSGAVALFPFIDMGLAVYESMSTFEEIKVEQYEELV